MKKVLRIVSLVLIVCILILGLTGCGEEKTVYDKELEESLIDATEKSANATRKAQKKEFNVLASYYNYEGDISAQDTKNLIELLNDYKEAIDVKGIDTVNAVNSQSTYNVSFERDEEGLISVVTIKEN